MNDKYEGRDIQFKGKWAKKLENFWYYYKWHTILSLVAILVFTILIAQSCTKVDHDVTIMYAGPYDFTENNDTGYFVEDLNGLMPEDFNRDGEKNANFLSYFVMTEEQIQEYKATLEDLRQQGEAVGYLDTGYIASQKKDFDSTLMFGQYFILLVDEATYLELESIEFESGAKRLRKLSEIFVTVPSSAFSEYGIRFSETALYQNSKFFGKLPENTVLCLAAPQINSNKTQYANSVEMFCAMAED